MTTQDPAQDAAATQAQTTERPSSEGHTAYTLTGPHGVLPLREEDMRLVIGALETTRNVDFRVRDHARDLGDDGAADAISQRITALSALKLKLRRAAGARFEGDD